MTTQEVIKQFLAHKSAHTPYRNAPLNNLWRWRGASLTSTGDKLISYETVVAEWRNGSVAITPIKYSATTSKQCGMLRNECNRLNVKTEAMNA